MATGGVPFVKSYKFGFRDDCEKCGSQKTEEAVAEVGAHPEEE